LGDPNFAGNSLFSASLSPDGLTLYFGLYIQGLPTEVVASSTRPAIGGAFGFGNLLPAPINVSIEGTPRLASDDLALYFYSERAGGQGGRDLYRAQRAAPGGNFDGVTNIVELNSASMDHLPWVSVDQLSLYFSSDRDGDLGIYRSTRAATSEPWGAPAPVAELNSPALEAGMTLTSDQRVILFSSNRLGGSDLFRATRAPGQTVFGAPEVLASISSPAEDVDPALSPDGTELYFSSTRDGIDSRLWRVSRSCP
jgi:Tol biopolymer transport system component